MFVYQTDIRMDGAAPVVRPTVIAAEVMADTAATWSDTLRASGVVLSNDDQTAAGVSDGNNRIGLGEVAIGVGEKVRIEIVGDGDTLVGVGVGNASTDLTVGKHIGDAGGNDIGWLSDGRLFLNNTVIATYATYASTDVIDMDVSRPDGTVEFFKNGESQGDPVSHGITGDLRAAYNVKSAGDTLTLVQPGAYTHAPPSDFTEYAA